MASKGFTDLPVTVREQIYAELLIAPTIEDPGILPSSPKNSNLIKCPTKSRNNVSTGIMYTNRQIYVESSDLFYNKNLFTCVHFNDYYCSLESDKLVETIRTLCFAVLDSAEEIPNDQFAMSLQLAMLGRAWDGMHLERIAFVFPAQTLPFLFKYLSMASIFSTEVVVAKFHIHNTFRYSLPRFSEHMFGALLAAKRFPKWKALSVHGPIDPRYMEQLVQKIPCDQEKIWYDFAGVFASWKSSVHYRMERQEELYNWRMKWSCKELSLLLLCLDVVWDFHSYLGYRHNKDYAQISLFQSTADVYGMLVLGYLFQAKLHPDEARHFHLLARQAAEDGISYLKRDGRSMDVQIYETPRSQIREEYINIYSHAKAGLSLKAYKACVKLKDGKAAGHYISDAERCDPDMRPTSQELHLRLRWKCLPPLNNNQGSPAVCWDERYSTRRLRGR